MKPPAFIPFLAPFQDSSNRASKPMNALLSVGTAGLAYPQSRLVQPGF